MNPCEKCPIDDKIFECCGRFPVSGDTSLFSTNENRSVFACPNLITNGKCGIYENRPYVCQNHHCYCYDAMNGVGEGFQTMKDQWGKWHDSDEN